MLAVGGRIQLQTQRLFLSACRLQDQDQLPDVGKFLALLCCTNSQYEGLKMKQIGKYICLSILKFDKFIYRPAQYDHISA